MKFFKILVLSSILFIQTALPSPKKVVSISPAITEIIFYTGNEKYMIGNTIYCTIPKEAKKIPKIGGIINPNIEKIVALKPEMIITTTITPNNKTKLMEKLGISVKTYQIETIEDIEKVTESVANIFERREKKFGEKFRKSYKKTIKKLSKCLKGKKTLIVFSSNPIYTAGNSTFLGEIINDAEGINIAGNGKYKTISAEYLLSRNPDFVILATMEGKATGKLFKELGIKVIKVNSTYLLKPGPYIIKGIKQLRKAVCIEEQF